MTERRIIGIVLIKNEDRFIELALRNIIDFCDEIIITDNNSTDGTWEIINKMASNHPSIRVLRIDHPMESHKAIEHFAGTDSWIFAVDGDEIYDPKGLQVMKKLILEGVLQDFWCIYGNVLHCTEIDRDRKIAHGYLTPPSRSMTKLYNFSLIESWTNCPEKLLSGDLVFKPNKQRIKKNIFKEFDWDSSPFRCLHAVFLNRSSNNQNSVNKTRLNPAEIASIQSALKRKSYGKALSRYIRYNIGTNWKKKYYRLGRLTEKNIASFL